MSIGEEMATLPFHLVFYVLSIGGCSSELVFYHALYSKLNHEHAKDEAIAKALPEPKRPSWYVDNGYLVGSCLMARPNSLIQAAMKGHVDATRWLIKVASVEASVNIDAKDENGATALIWAAIKGHPEVVKLLLDAGADKDAVDYYGKPVLIFAAIKGHTEVVKVLLDAGADKEARCKTECTALMLAAHYGRPEVVKVLLNAGANKEARCGYGLTALMLVEQDLLEFTNLGIELIGRLKVVKVLLNAGADKDC